MSGGPPHHSHNRQTPPTNSAWNHLQVPNYYPNRQPQHAHMSNEHSILPTWHTPTTTATTDLKPTTNTQPITHSHIFGLEQMLSDRQYQRHPGVDLTKNGGNIQQNGDLNQSPISLSVRDTNKINSLPASALDIDTTAPPPPITTPPTILKSVSPNLQQQTNKNRTKRVDSILERLNPNLIDNNNKTDDDSLLLKSSVIVQTANSNDENSNSSSLNTTTTTTTPSATIVVEDDNVFSNDDSLDSNKSRRKRKPCKTIRVTKETDDKQIDDNKNVKPDQSIIIINDNKDNDNNVPMKRRRRTCSETETIDNIAAMVQEGLKEKYDNTNKSIGVSVIIKNNTDNDNVDTTVVTSAQKKLTPTTNFVEVENKLEEMFAGIDDNKDNVQTPTTSQDNVTSTSNELIKLPKQKKRKTDAITAKKKIGNKRKLMKNKNKKLQQQQKSKIDVKDVYAYDSGSNASSNKSRGPFIQIRGPRESPISVNIINTPISNIIDDDLNERKVILNKKKYHDDSEYRNKVRTKGLHCSTLSNQYDAQTKDATWICAFCKRGPHATELTGPTIVNSNATILTTTIAAGDLFGPYFITSKSPEYERRLVDPYDKQFKSKKITKVLDMIKVPAIINKKKRKSSLDLDERFNDVYFGIVDNGNNTFEIWAHEDCIVWSNNTYLVGPKIIGLEEAIWTSCNVVCMKCHLKGANLCCLKRGCLNVMHVCCARLNHWQFDDDNFKAYCPEHKLV